VAKNGLFSGESVLEHFLMQELCTFLKSAQKFASFDTLIIWICDLWINHFKFADLRFVDCMAQLKNE
jgi:hypothetical protein